MKKNSNAIVLACLLTAVLSASCALPLYTDEHTHYFTQEVAIEMYRAGENTFYKSCTCGMHSEKETFEWNNDHVHVIGDDGVCQDCGKKFDTSSWNLVSIVPAGGTELDYCGLFYCEETDTYAYRSATQSELGLPVINLKCDISKATKDKNSIDVEVEYFSDDINFTDNSSTIKVQGSSSVNYPKKNYTLKLGSKIKLVKEWGKQKKYCLKANYIDFSQARNVVSGKLYGDVVKTNDSYDELLADTPNGGAIDGYPVLVYNNGQLLGLYTLNIPKDKWMFSMKTSDEKNQAIISTKRHSPEAFLLQKISPKFDGTVELEFASNEESEIDSSTEWVAESFNEMVDFVQHNSGEKFKNGISEYIDVDLAIDAMIFTYAIGGSDNYSKNMLWVTKDGKLWFPSVYDMDGTWGMLWDGYNSVYPWQFVLDKAPTMLLWKKIYRCYYPQICERYAELRATVLSDENIVSEFTDFMESIPEMAFEAERQMWPLVYRNDDDNLKQITTWAVKHMALMDKALLK